MYILATLNETALCTYKQVKSGYQCINMIYLTIYGVPHTCILCTQHAQLMLSVPLCNIISRVIHVHICLAFNSYKDMEPFRLESSFQCNWLSNEQWNKSLLSLSSLSKKVYTFAKLSTQNWRGCHMASRECVTPTIELVQNKSWASLGQLNGGCCASLLFL